MRTSADRILTTHVGSLPRPVDLLRLANARQADGAIDEAGYRARVREAVAAIVKKQADLGIDVVSDGEMSKPSFITYINDRLGGFEVDSADRNQSPWVGSREVKAFPDYYAPQLKNVHTRHKHLICTGPVTYKGAAGLKSDLEHLKAALGNVKVSEAFVPATSVSSIEDWNRNRYYKSEQVV